MDDPNTWQTPAALLIVAVTITSFIIGILKRKKSAGCGSGCVCPVKPKPNN